MTPTPTPALPELPHAWLGVRFVSEDRRLYVVVRRADPARAISARFPLAVEVGRPATGLRLLAAAPGRWIPREDEEADSGLRRLDRVQVELGTPSMGETYELLFARPTDDRARWRGRDWAPVRPDTALRDLAVFPEHGGTPFGSDDWDWQEGWWYPYSTFHAEPDGA